MSASTLTVISLIINIGLIALCLSLVYPKAIQVYKEKKNLREKQANKGIQELVKKYTREYLEELKKD